MGARELAGGRSGEAGNEPLFAGRIHGIRTWTVEWTADGALNLVGYGQFAWARDGEPTRAECALGGHALRGLRRHTPARDCSCGLYAIHPFAAHDHCLIAAVPTVNGIWQISGIVEAWGRVEVHRTGFRAELARPVAFAVGREAARADYGRAVGLLADAYGADVLEIDDPDDIAQHCGRHGLGLGRDVVDELLFRDEPEAQPPAPAAPAPPPPPTRLQRGLAGLPGFGELLWLGILTLVMGALWLVMASVPVMIVLSLLGVIDDGAQPGELFSRDLKVLEQTVIRQDGELRYVALVRNTSEGSAALGVTPRGRLLDRAGDVVGHVHDRSLIDIRPSLAPGGTGVVIDRLGRGYAGLDPDDGLQYEFELRARRERPRTTRRVPVEYSAVELDRGSCRIAATASADPRAPRSEATLVGRDREGEISAVGVVSVGAVRAGRSPVVLVRGRGPCPDGIRSVDVFPNPAPETVRGASR